MGRKGEGDILDSFPDSEGGQEAIGRKGPVGGQEEDLKRLVEKQAQGIDPGTIVPDDYVVVRGGRSELPALGQTFSGSTGATITQAGGGVPHGTIRATTAGAIRAQDGMVEYAPELTRSGAMNFRHVNVTEGKTTVFGSPQPNPVPKGNRVW